MLNPFKLLKIYKDLNKLEEVVKEKTTMKLKIPQLLTLLISLSGTIGVPVLATNWLHVHLTIYIGFVVAAILLHAIFPSIFSAPSATDMQATGLNKVGMILLMIGLGAMCAGRVQAQDSTTTTTTDTSAITVTAGTDAVVVFENGNKDAASLISVDLKFATFGKRSGHILYLTERNLLDPSYANTYAAGIAYQPDLTDFFKKTLIPSGNFGIAFGGAIGNKIPVSGTDSHVVGLFNVKASYRASSKLSWNVMQYIAQVGPTGVDHAMSMGIAAHF